MNLPENWPQGFSYSPISLYLGISQNLFRHLLSTTHPESRNRIAPCIENQTVHLHLAIRKITENFRCFGKMPHPLVGQYGVFAHEKIPKETELGEYVGEVSFGKEDSEIPRIFKGVHCWRASFGSFLLHISSERIANELAFINDFRGVQKDPNVRPKWILHRGAHYFGFETIREIGPMEELLVDYGKTWEKTRGLA
jgi:hypothetical protein